MSIPELKEHLRWVVRVAREERSTEVARWYAALEELEWQNRTLQHRLDAVTLERDLVKRALEQTADRVVDLETEEKTANRRTQSRSRLSSPHDL